MNDVIGLEEAKEFIKDKIILPMKFPQLFSGALSPKKGFLFFGPASNGKCINLSYEQILLFF
jgi:katanin p60 ATPase-containing subunit A1